MDPKVSVIMPVYNGADYIKIALSSIQGQSFQDWELIIVDDGSRDRSLEICKGFASTDSRVRIYENENNRGLAATMNRLVSLVNGKYIAVQEQDDFSFKDRILQEVEFLDSNPAIGLISGIAEWVDDDGKLIGYFPGILEQGGVYPQDLHQMVRFLYVEQCKVVNAACMFRAEILKEMPIPFDEEAKISVDWQFFLHLAHQWKIWGLPEKLVRMNRGRNHQHLTANKSLQFAEARRCILKMYKEYGKDPSSPIDYLLYRRAVSTELTLEGRSYSRLKGILLLIQAIGYYPLNKKAWISLFDIVRRGLMKLLPGSIYS